MKALEILEKLQGVKKSGEGWVAKCPAHEDRNPSLSITEGRDGTLLHCHAGCSTESVAAAMGLRLADLFNGNGTPERKARGTIVATYDYTDEAGKLLFQVVRMDPKDFRQRRPDGNGGWIWGTKGIRRVPFHLPELLKAIKDERPVYIVEGEKDVLAMESVGFAATCNPGGAGKWRSEYQEFFRGAKEIIIIADKDQPGRDHADKVRRALCGFGGAAVRQFELKDVNGKPVKDASDFFAAGGQPAEVDELTWQEPLEFEAEPEAKPEVKPSDWAALVEDGAELQARELPELVQIVEGIVAELSKLSICSSAKCFKTWLTIYLSLAIAHGLEFLGRKTTRRKVLYVNLELKPQTFTRRLQAIAKALGITVDPKWFFHLSLRGKLAGLTVHEIISRIGAVANVLGARVIVVDPLFKLNIEGEENSSRDSTVFCNELDRLTTEFQATAIFNDHSGKGNQSEKEPLDVIRGSSAKGGDLDAAMVLRKHEVENCFRVDLVHRELPPVAPFVIGWRYPLMELRAELSSDDMKKAKAGRRKAYDPRALLAFIADSSSEKPISINAWAKAAGMKRQTLTDYLTGLRVKGWIQTAGEGKEARQYITPAGREAAQKHGEETE